MQDSEVLIVVWLWTSVFLGRDPLYMVTNVSKDQVAFLGLR